MGGSLRGTPGCWCGCIYSDARTGSLCSPDAGVVPRPEWRILTRAPLFLGVPISPQAPLPPLSLGRRVLEAHRAAGLVVERRIYDPTSHSFAYVPVESESLFRALARDHEGWRIRVMP